ncbi:response regulator [Paucibacter sp. O1-1]|nr:response regulator [Paucibacter sp. O1-1]MDA3826186.1 response regulator [Paucibacter sp. O1-1]
MMTILYVDHEINNLNSFKATFRRDATVFVASSTREGLEILQEHKIDVIFADHQMPEMTGLEFLKLASKQFPASIRIILTGNAYTDEFKIAAGNRVLSQLCQQALGRAAAEAINDSPIYFNFFKKNECAGSPDRRFLIAFFRAG